MPDNLKIIQVEKPGSAEWMAIGYGIQAYNEAEAGDDNTRHVCFVLKDETDTIVGGIIGAVYWNWFYVDLMWLRAELRNQGYGSRLLELAENEARAQGAVFAYLDSFSFQAPGFYEKFGYEVFGRLDDFPPGHNRYFLKKAL